MSESQETCDSVNLDEVLDNNNILDFSESEEVVALGDDESENEEGSMGEELILDNSQKLDHECDIKSYVEDLDRNNNVDLSETEEEVTFEDDKSVMEEGSMEELYLGK